MPETTSPPVPTIPVSFDQIAQVFQLAAPRLAWFPYPKHELVFSCSTNGTWPVTRWGIVPPHERVDVAGQSLLLDIAAVLMMAFHSVIGGRFVVSLDGVFRAHDRTPICMFEVGA